MVQQYGLVLEVITFSAAVSAWEKGDQWLQAPGPLVAMQLSGVAPGVVDAAAWLRAQCHHLQRCQQFLWKGSAMAAGAWAPGDGAAVWSDSRGHYLQRCSECL
jgi:hypothetical protein